MENFVNIFRLVISFVKLCKVITWYLQSSSHIKANSFTTLPISPHDQQPFIKPCTRWYLECDLSQSLIQISNKVLAWLATPLQYISINIMWACKSPPRDLCFSTSIHLLQCTNIELRGNLQLPPPKTKLKILSEMRNSWEHKSRLSITSASNQVVSDTTRTLEEY